MNRTSATIVGKKILFACIVIAAFFASGEIVLWMFGVTPLIVTQDPFVGFDRSSPLFVERTQPDGTVTFVTAENKLGYFNAQQFPKIKHAGTFRIFCLGGSTTYGHPFEDSTSFCGWLREFLPIADPSKNWEVVNAGGISYASYREANLMNELSRYQPDLFIIYTGQNEFLEERTYRKIIDLPDWVINARVLLSRSRLFTVMNKALDPSSGSRRSTERHASLMKGEVREILNDTIGPTSYVRNETLKREILTHFRFNLDRMVAIAKAAGSKILFITPASNMKDLSPFKSEHRTGMTGSEKDRWNSLYQEGKKLLKAKEPDGALARFNDAARIDNSYADLLFDTGRALFALKRYDEAKRSFQHALDEDICALRALSPITAAVRQAATENGVYLIDFVKLLEADSRNRFGHDVLGKEYFLDHVHPTIEANRMLALALVDLFKREGIAVTSAALNAQAIDAVTRSVEGSIDTRKQAHALIMLGKTLDWAGKLDEGYQLLVQAAEMLGDNSFDVLATLANSAARRGMTREAVAYYRKALKYESGDGNAHFNLAYFLQERGDVKEALAQYAESIRLNTLALQKGTQNNAAFSSSGSAASNIVNAHCNIALILEEQGRTKEALDHYREALERNPDLVPALTGMGVLLAREGRDGEAVDRLTEAIRLRPDQARAHYNLALVYDKQGRLDEAAAEYREAIRLDAASADSLNNLGVVYAKQGRLPEASAQFAAAVAVRPDNADAHFNLAMALAREGKWEEAELHRAEAERIRAATRGGVARQKDLSLPAPAK